MELLVDIFKLFGVSQASAEWASQQGMIGLISVIILVSLKLIVIPSIGKWLERRTFFGEKLLQNIELINTTVLENYTVVNESIIYLKSEVENNKLQYTSIGDKIDVLLGENNGNLDARLALTTFASYIHKQHLIALVFYNIRVRSNHMSTQKSVIHGRYLRKSSELSSKTFTTMGYYSYKRMPLSTFFLDEHTCNLYFDTVLLGLFNAHEKVSENNNFLTDEDIESALDRQLSRIMGAFKHWLQDNTQTLNTKLPENKFDLWQHDGQIDIL